MTAPIRPTTARIDLDALRHNFKVVQAHVGEGVRVLAPVKGSAYGHGAVQCAQALEQAGCDAFGVALVEEGVALRKAGIRSTILCLAGVGNRGPEEAVRWDLTPMVYDLDTASALAAVGRSRGRPVEIHLKVDTGMGRLGVLPGGWPALLDGVGALAGLSVEGIATHFCDADLEEDNFTEMQADRFRQALAVAADRGFSPRWTHASNSAAALRYPQSHPMVRAGLALYGVAPRFGPALDLRPVMQVETEVLAVKTLPAGWGVSYGRTWTAREETRVATLPVGYADGYPRALSNRADVLLHGHRCPVRGAVCMDLLNVDVSGVEGPVNAGDPVILLGGGITASELAERAGTIPYDILCSFSERVPRSFEPV